jgi:WD40 repeat protein
VCSDAKGWITDVKFNPVNASFAVGSVDNKIYIYNRDRMRLKGTCSKHNGAIREFDYSVDGRYIQSDSADNEKLFFEAEDGEYFTGSAFLKDTHWVHGTSVFGWHVLGERFVLACECKHANAGVC